MNVKFRMPKLWKYFKFQGTFKELTLSIVGTTISIILTFGTSAYFERRQQEENRRLTTMMVLSNIDNFTQNMRNIDSTLVEWDSTLTRIVALPRDSVLRLNNDEGEAFFAALFGSVLLQRDKTAENIFTNDISTWRDVGNLRFISSVGECYSFINDIEKNYRIQLDRKNEIYQHFIEEYDYKNMTYGEIATALLGMKETKYFIEDFTGGFVLYFEQSIDNLLKFNSYNMKVIGVTHEEVTDFIKSDEETTE